MRAGDIIKVVVEVAEVDQAVREATRGEQVPLPPIKGVSVGGKKVTLDITATVE